MQKKLIALAVAGLVAAPAFAQSNVQITGIAAISVTNSKIGNTSRQVTDENRLDDQTSRFTLKGSEDLGGGLSAYFQMENRVSLDTRPNASGAAGLSGLTDGESFVGIKHNKLGQIGFGKFAMHYHEFLGYSESYRALNNQSLASVGILSAVNGAWVGTNSRTPNTMKYDTPNWNGLSAKVAYSFSPNAGSTHVEGAQTTTGVGASNNGWTAAGVYNADDRYEQGRSWQAAARYYTGKINAFVSYYDQQNEGDTRAKTKSYKVGFDYTFPFGLKAGFGFDHSAIRGARVVNLGTAAAPVLVSGELLDSKRDAWMIPVSYAFGANTVYLTYAKAKDTKGNLGNNDNTGAVQWNLMYDRALSKRTFVGVHYISLKNDSKGGYGPFLAGFGTGSSYFTTDTGLSWRQVGFNMTHFF